jgi:hypothetical protein
MGGEMLGMIMMVDPEDSLSASDLQLIRETAAEVAPPQNEQYESQVSSRVGFEDTQQLEL